jgi:hypothetical protein
MRLIWVLAQLLKILSVKLYKRTTISLYNSGLRMNVFRRGDGVLLNFVGSKNIDY